MEDLLQFADPAPPHLGEIEKAVVPSLIDSEWIGGPGNQFCRFEFALEQPPRRAVLRVIADPHSYAISHWQILPSDYPYDNGLIGGSFVKYRVFLNGTLAAVGPLRSLEDGIPVLMEYPVSDQLWTGKNAVAVLSRGENRGFALVLEIEESGGEIRRIHSTEKWRQCPANEVYRTVCWECPGLDQFAKGGQSPGEYPEHIDGRIYPQGWKEPGYDDAAWAKVKCYGRANDECEISSPSYVIAPCQPRSIKKLGPGNFLLDFGRMVFGGVELSGPTEGAEVELRLAEELQPNGHARFQLRTENCFQERWIFSPHSEPLSHLGTRLFRYAEVCGWRGELSPGQLTVWTIGMPFDFHASEFHCSDDRLESVWHLCKNTIAHTTADIYTDCLTRERTAYEADSYVTMLTQFGTEGSTETARRTLAYLARHPTWPCEWRQCFIPLFHEFLLHSGDLDFVDEYFALLHEQSTFHRLMENGLILKFPLECIVDWPKKERDNFEFGPGNAVGNAFAYWDLEQLSQLAIWLGREKEANRLTERARELLEGFNQNLFDEDTGLYVDSVGSRHSSFHANMYALRFGLVPLDRRPHCLKFIKSRGMGGSVFAAQFLLEMLFLNDEAAHAVKLMSSEGERSWLEMIRHGAVATTESWLSDPKLNMSWAHPWGTAPANVIVRHLFGLRPTAPGWASFASTPNPGGLEKGSLRISTPRGPLSASFEWMESDYRIAVSPEFDQTWLEKGNSPSLKVGEVQPEKVSI